MSAPSPRPPTDIVTMLRRHAHDRPAAACLCFGDDCQSFAELDARRAHRILGLLDAEGLGQAILAVPRATDIPEEFTRLARVTVRDGTVEA